MAYAFLDIGGCRVVHLKTIDIQSFQAEVNVFARIPLRGLIEVTGDPNDPMTETRAQIFEPLSQQLAATLKEIVGKGQRTVVRQPIKKISPAPPEEKITSEQIRCPRCGEVAALLILANHTKEVAEMEDVPERLSSVYEEL